MSRTSKIMVAMSVAMTAISAFEAAKADDGKITPDEYSELLSAMLPGLEMAGVDRSLVQALQRTLVKIGDATDDNKLSLLEIADTLGDLLQAAGVPIEWDFGDSPVRPGNPGIPDMPEGPTTQES